MPNGSDEQRGGAAQTAAKAVQAVQAAKKWGLRARWLLGCTGCGGCLPGCGTVLLVVIGLVLFITILYYGCEEYFGGWLGWLESLAARIGLSPGICDLLK